MDLRSYSVDDLMKLRKRIDDELRARHAVEPEPTEHQLQDAAQKWGYALTEVLTGIIPDYERKAMRAKYRHPYDPNLVWSGAGRKPDWIRQWESDGHSLENLRIR